MITEFGRSSLSQTAVSLPAASNATRGETAFSAGRERSAGGCHGPPAGRATSMAVQFRPWARLLPIATFPAPSIATVGGHSSRKFPAGLIEPPADTTAERYPGRISLEGPHGVTPSRGTRMMRALSSTLCALSSYLADPGCGYRRAYATGRS